METLVILTWVAIQESARREAVMRFDSDWKRQFSSPIQIKGHACHLDGCTRTLSDDRTGKAGKEDARAFLLEALCTHDGLKRHFIRN